MYDLAGGSPLFTPGLLIQAPDVRSGGDSPLFTPGLLIQAADG